MKLILVSNVSLVLPVPGVNKMNMSQPENNGIASDTSGLVLCHHK